MYDEDCGGIAVADEARAGAAFGTARVRAVDGAHIALCGRVRPARRAAACLIVPACGDLVAYLACEHGDYVVTVLERDAAELAQVALPAHSELAADTLRIAAGEIALEGEDVRIRARGLRLLYDTLDSLGRCWTLAARTARMMGASWSTVFERVDQHAQSQLRTVHGLDQSRAGMADHAAEGLMRLHAENLLANGEQLAKVRASQVHLG